MPVGNMEIRRYLYVRTQLLDNHLLPVNPMFHQAPNIETSLDAVRWLEAADLADQYR